MKKFSTRVNKWFYVFALISHILNFFAKLKILFFYYINDHQENYLFFEFFYSTFKLIFKLSFFFFLFIYIIFFYSFLLILFIFFIFFEFFSFFSFFSNFSLLFSSFFNFRRSFKCRFSSSFVICSIFKRLKKFFFFLFLIFFLFLSICFTSLN